MMELISTDDHYIFQQLVQSEHALWVNRHTGTFSMHASWDLAQESNPECLGAVWGLVGKLKIHPSMEDQLVVIRNCERAIELPDPSLQSTYPVYTVKSVALIPLSTNPPSEELKLKSCPKHHVGVVDPVTGQAQSSQSGLHEADASKFPFKSLGGKFKLAGETLGTVAGGITNQVKVPWKKDKESSKDLDRLEKRLLDEFLKLFNDSHGFYFSFTGDVTSNLQKQHEYRELNKDIPVWRRVDDRFFFNKALVQEVIDLQDSRCDPWILPLIQGYIELRECSIDSDLLAQLGEDSKLPHSYRLCVISRRAPARAGTRYKRRGVDEEGKVANYVETEQIVLYHSYALSFVQIRGSIPVFWSQPGLKYRPPPRIDKNENENLQAFTKHFQEQLEMYGPISCISLVERSGREKVLSDVFLDNLTKLEEEDVSFVSFDFHEHCRGMKFENVSVLIDTIQEMVSRMGYFWVDAHGKVCAQKGVFRVNCVDCLDRTNVVQTAIARLVMETQLTKLGVVQPEQGLSQSCKMNFQSLWANNGDMVSRQYAGTNALKGDYTRTGERNLSGLVKDGVNSASRYYLNQIRDTYKQAAIDLLIGKEIGDELLKTEKGELDEVDNSTNTEHVKSVIEDCKKQITQDYDEIIGSWGLIDADLVTGNPDEDDMDVVFILTRNGYYFARYDDDIDKITGYEYVQLEDVLKVECGVPEQSFSLFNKSETHCFRILFKVNGEDGYHHMLRSTNMKFFNNIVSLITTEDEKIESLKAIADTVAVTMEAKHLKPEIWFGKLEKRRSKSSKPILTLNPVDILHMTREKSPNKLKTVGTKTLANVTSQFSKLNPISRLKRTSPKDFTDIRQEELDVGNEAFEEDFDEDLKYLNSLHLPSSGLLMNSSGEPADDSVNLCVQNNSISYSKNQSHSNSQLSSSTEDTSMGDQHLAPTRTRKLSKSSEDVNDVPRPRTLRTVFDPFSKISKGLQNIGSNIDQRFSVPEGSSAAQYQYMSFAESQVTSPNITSPAEEVKIRQSTFSDDIQRKIERSSTKSLILFI